MIAIECFSCSGGMAEGFRRVGVEFTWVFDKDPNACASYEHNLGHRPVQMDVTDLLRMARGGWTPGPIDLFVADPPCTPWSRAGKRLGVEDERDMLHATTELISLLRPRAYLIGNVPGLDDSTQWHHLQDALAPLRKLGYCIADYGTFDAADFGVPQHRVRPFWFGHLAGPCIRWPLPTHGPPGQPALPGLGLKPWVTCRQALGHLPPEDLGRPVRLQRVDPKHPPCEPDAPGTTVRSGGNGNAAPHVVLNARHPPAELDEPAATVGAKDRGQSTVLRLEDPNRPPFKQDGQAATITAGGRGNTALLEWPWDQPSTVVFAGTAQTGGPGHGSPGNRPNAIALSERAAAILQGFPEGWLFSGETKRARWSQIGQAMPPPLAHAVSTSVVEQLRATERQAELRADLALPGLTFRFGARHDG